MPIQADIVLGIIIFIWLGGLTFFLLRSITHYNNLTKNAVGKDLTVILEELLKTIRIHEKDIAFLRSRCDTIEKDGKLHIQKIGLLRFNPFKDTGGDQSFILVLTDGRDTGVAISGLYSRSGTRWYAKKIVEGKGLEHDLSEEEKKAVKEARSL